MMVDEKYNYKLNQNNIMQLSKIIAITALLGFTSAVRLTDDSDPNGKN